MASNVKPMSGLWTALTLILLTALMVPAAWFPSKGWGFIAVMVLMLLFVITLGVKISGRPAGILITERNLISLSRFQTVLWTLIILSAFLTMALQRIRSGVDNPLDIALEWELWALMGISTASLIGSPLVQATKKTKELSEDDLKKAAAKLSEEQKDIKDNSQGTLYSNKDIKDARFSDMFEGDEVRNTAYVDLAKVQMFFFTMVAALSYGVILFRWIASREKDLAAFPTLSEGFIAILGISHGGYLVNKSTDHSQPAPPNPPPK